MNILPSIRCITVVNWHSRFVPTRCTDSLEPVRDTSARKEYPRRSRASPFDVVVSLYVTIPKFIAPTVAEFAAILVAMDITKAPEIAQLPPESLARVVIKCEADVVDALEPLFVIAVAVQSVAPLSIVTAKAVA